MISEEYKKILYNHYKELLVGAEDWAIERACEEDLQRQEHAEELKQNVTELKKELQSVSAENIELNRALDRLARPFFPEESATLNDENTRLRAENFKLNKELQFLRSRNARWEIETSIINDIIDGTYNPSGNDFDYETDLTYKVQKFVSNIL